MAMQGRSYLERVDALDTYTLLGAATISALFSLDVSEFLRHTPSDFSAVS